MRNKKLIVIFSILLALTLLVVLNSVLFSVRTVTAHCFNYDDTIIENDGKKLADKVIESAGIKKGSSIFLVNKEKTAANIVARQTGVKVVNIEKRFPNRITIHYAKLVDTFQVAMPRGYYICTNDGRIVEIVDKPLPVQNIIGLRMSVSPDLAVGDFLDLSLIHI